MISSIFICAFSHLVVRAVEAAREFSLQADLGGGLLQKVGDPLNEEVPILQVRKQKSHAILGTDGQGTGQHIRTVCFLNNGDLEGK